MGDKKNLSRNEAIEKIIELVEKINTCMFCTQLHESPFATRPMGTIKVDEQGALWFFSNKNSDKNHEIAESSDVQLLYSDPKGVEFLNIYGDAEIIHDKEKAKELWKPLAKVWFKDGPEDAELSIIKVIPRDGHYWDTKHGCMVAFTKMLVSTVTGATMDDGVEGKLSAA